MQDLTAAMLTALAARTPATTTTISRNRTLLWEVYDKDYFPDVDGIFNPDDAIAHWAKTQVIWQGNTYQRRIVAHSPIAQHLSGEFDNATLTIENADRYLSNFILTNDIAGMRLVARYINIDLSATLSDSVVRFVGRIQAPEGSDIDREQGDLTAKEELASLDIEIPKRRISPDDPEGRSPNDPLFEGFLFNSRPSTVKFVETQTGKGWFGLFPKKREVVKYNQWSSQGPSEDQIVPLIFGRVQMEGLPAFWADIGFYVIGIWVFAGHKVTSITNFQLPDSTYIFHGPWATELQQQEHVHLGDPGGTGTNAAPDDIEATYPQNTALLSRTGYTGFAVGGPESESQPFANPQADDVPTLVGIVRGEVDLPDIDGNFTTVGFSDSPVYIARFVLTSQDCFGLDPRLVYDGELPDVHAERSRPVVDKSNGELLFLPNHDAAALIAGDFDRFGSSGVLSPAYFKAIASAGDDPLITSRTDAFSAAFGPEEAVAGGDQELFSGVPITGETVANGVWNYYYITIPLGATQLVITATGSGDAAMYSRALEKPTESIFAGFAYTASPVILTHTNPPAGLGWIGILGKPGGASYDIEAVITGGTTSSAGSGLQKFVRKAYTFNAPLTDTVNASDFLNEVVLPTGRLYKITDSAGRIRIRAKKASDSAYLIADAAGGTAATGTVTIDTLPADGDTVTFNGINFIFRTNPSLGSEIRIGTTVSLQVEIIIAAIDASDDELVADATYVNSGSGVLTVTHEAGAAGNAYTLAKSSSHITLSGSTLSGGVDGDSSVQIANVEPWRASDRGYVLISVGLVTSETRAVTGAEYDESVGDTITLTVNDASLTPSGGTLAGGSSSAPSTGTVTVSTLAAAGTELIVTVWDIPISYTVSADDDVNSIAGILAASINADPNLRQYVRAEWNEADLVTISSTVGILSFADPLLNDHIAQLDSPVVEPTASAVGSGTLDPGDYYLAYSYVDGSGNETLISPLKKVTIATGEKVSVASLLPLPSGVAEVNWYFSPAVNDDHVQFFDTSPGGSFLIDTVADHDADYPISLNTTGGETIRVMEVFNERNIRKNTFKWCPSRSQINQVAGSFVDAANGFKRTSITVNDRAHQRAIRKVNKKDINLSGVDSFSQASRLCHATLAEERDAGTRWKWVTDDAGIPLEVGDVVCVSGNYVDLSGVVQEEFVNQPVIIETTELGEDFDVSFVGMVYSSALLEGQTGRRPIIISSTLKYLSEPPLVAANLVLAINNNTLTGFIGDFSFGTWAGSQSALIYLAGPSDTEPEEDDYQLMDKVTPDDENNGHFELLAPTSDKYWIKVVTQSQFGKSATTGHPVELIDLRPAAPISLTGLFNEITDDCLIEWLNNEPRTPLGLEVYQLQIAVPGDGDFSTVRDIGDIDPNDWNQYVVWDIAGASLTNMTVTGLENGGLNFADTASTGQSANVTAKQIFLVGRGAMVELEIPNDRRLLSDLGLSSGSNGLSVGRFSENPPGTTAGGYAVFVSDGIETVAIYTAVPGDRFSIVIRPDGQGQIFLNRLDSPSNPMFVSTVPFDKSAEVSIVASNTSVDGATDTFTGGVRNVTLSRFTPEWLYLAAAQLEDNSDVLPPTINARVRQLGFIEGGTPSDWTTATFTR